ncbi:MAG: hypothetical protein RLZ65_938 [Actinomycetota bacterium]
MKRFVPGKKTIIKYLVISVLLGIGFFIYTDDHDAPALSDFKFSVSDENPLRFQYSGRLSDARGVASATFECSSESKTELVIVVGMSGVNRNQTSFGILSRSPNWSGNWRGTSYDLTFQGRADFPNDQIDIDCTWIAKLRDNLGNEAVLTDIQKTQIRIG